MIHQCSKNLCAQIILQCEAFTDIILMLLTGSESLISTHEYRTFGIYDLKSCRVKLWTVKEYWAETHNNQQERADHGPSQQNRNMAANSMNRSSSWARWPSEKEKQLVELWQQYEFLFNVLCKMYHDRTDKLCLRLTNFISNSLPAYAANLISHVDFFFFFSALTSPKA